jgi:hypothetical protein
MLWQLDGVQLGEVLVNLFGFANTISGRVPPKHISVWARNRAYGGDLLDCLIIKNVSQELEIPVLCVREPKVGDN